MPTSTDLVTDLPADFEVFGQAVATSMADLLGGTSGQILAKNSNTDMDFVWVTTDDANAIQNSIVDAKGDIVAASANDTPARLAVGTNGQTIIADSTAATGLKYSSNAPLGGLSLISSAALTGAATITFSSLANYSRFILYTTLNTSTTTGGSYVGVRLNGQAANYGYAGLQVINATAVTADMAIATDRMYTNRQGAAASDTFSFLMHINGCFSTGLVQYAVNAVSNGVNGTVYNNIGWATPGGQVTSISLVANDNFDAGTAYLYGA